MRKLLPVVGILVLPLVLGGFSEEDQVQSQPEGLNRQWGSGSPPRSSDLSSPDAIPLVKQFEEDSHQRLLTFGMTGIRGAFRYGVTFRSAGKAFTTLQDQAMREVWGEWQRGVARLRGSLTEVWNNVERDPSHPRITQMQEKLSLTVAPTSWPELTLAYSRNVSSSSLEPTGVLPQRGQLDLLQGAVSYINAACTVNFSSAFSLNRDQLRSGMQTEGILHTLSGSFRPTALFTIAPSVSVREERQRWSGTRLQTPTATLAFTYTPDPTLTFTTAGSHSKTQSGDGLTDTSTFNATSMLRWTVQESSPLHTVLLFETSYQSSHDAIHPMLSSKDLTGLVQLQVVGF